MRYYISNNDTILSSIIDRTITSLSLKCDKVQQYCFYSCLSLSEVYLPNCKTIKSSAFQNCTSLQSVTLLQCSNIQIQAFSKCTSLSIFNLLSPFVCELDNTNAFTNTPISKNTYLGYYGSIYVPSNLVESYKAATNWSQYADRITAYTP